LTELVEEGTVDDNTIKAEPEGATTATTFVAGSNNLQQQQQMPTMSDVYRYQATDVEENEMEVREAQPSCTQVFGAH